MIRIRRVALAVIFPLLLSSFLPGQNPLNPAIERRIDDLLKRMTVEEKAGQLAQYDTDKAQNLDLVRQGRAGSLFNVAGPDRTNAAQRIAMEQSRLKIPLLFGLDVIHGYRTIFPVPLATASSFDLDLIQQSERVAAKEATADGVKWAFAPMVDIARDPRWGRIVEGSGEDPYLGSMIAAARVRGFQGANMADRQSLIACAKHFVAYGAVEGGRDYNTVDISEELLREVYLPPFHAAVEAGTGTIMAGFNDLNGVPATANHHTLSDILRSEWGFNGFVVSDYTSVKELIPHGIARDTKEAALRAVNAGVDMDMAGGDFGAQLPSLVKSGAVSMSRLDDAVRRVLRIKFQAGLFDNPYTDPRRAHNDILSPANLEIERKMAQESVVLLKNENNILPLDPKALNPTIKTIAVIGPLADSKNDQLGPWAGSGVASDAVTPLEGIKSKFTHSEVIYSKGTDIQSMEKDYSVNGAAPAPSTATGAAAVASGGPPARIEDAVAAAGKSDLVIMFLGELAQMSGEASARSSLDLPGKQQQLLEAVVATGKPVVLILESGRPLQISWADEHVGTILQAWFPGVQGGNAIADLLTGDAAPSARLPLSWPRSVGQIPLYYNHKSTGRPDSPSRWHTGYLDESKEPLFPFGFGLTYTNFKYSGLHLDAAAIRPSGMLRVSADLENAGSRAGTEVVQLYVHGRVAPTSRPVRELKGFQRITLAPGEHRKVEFTVNAHELGSYDPDLKWIVPAGTYDVWVAQNAAEGVAGQFEITGK